jgi:hypothetical protein
MLLRITILLAAILEKKTVLLFINKYIIESILMRYK